jgi:alpha-ribazole phosphatase
MEKSAYHDKQMGSIILIRHGKTLGNERHAYIGVTDEPLSEIGKRQVLHELGVGYYGRTDCVTKVLVSSMRRCLETANLIFPQAEKIVIPEWKEMDFGDFEGKNYEDLNGCEAYQKWIDSNGTLPFPNGESQEQFVSRVMKGYRRAKKILQYCDTGTWEVVNENRKEQRIDQIPEITAVIHGGTIMALCSELCHGNYFDYQIQNGAKIELCKREK